MHSSIDYGERPVNNHTLTCDAAANVPCWAQDMGCSLYDEAVNQRCKDKFQKDRCDKYHYVYLGTYKKVHDLSAWQMMCASVNDCLQPEEVSGN